MSAANTALLNSWQWLRVILSGDPASAELQPPQMCEDTSPPTTTNHLQQLTWYRMHTAESLCAEALTCTDVQMRLMHTDLLVHCCVSESQQTKAYSAPGRFHAAF